MDQSSEFESKDDIINLMRLMKKYEKQLTPDGVKFLMDLIRKSRKRQGDSGVELISLDFNSLDSDGINFFGKDSNGVDTESSVPIIESLIRIIRDLICKEYKNVYSEKTNKAICALLNSGGQYSQMINIDKIVIQFMKVIGRVNSSSMLEKASKKLDWSDIIIDEFCKVIYYDNIIQGELLKKLWVSFINAKGAGENANGINTIMNDALNNNLRIKFDMKGTSLVLLLSVEKPCFSDSYFCLKKRNRNPDYKTNIIGQKPIQSFVYDYFFYVGDKIVKTEWSHLRYFEIVSRNPELPRFKKYEPSEPISRKEFIEIRNKNNVDFEIIGELNNSSALYKYMDLESALLCLEKRIKGSIVEKTPNLRFVEPTSWDDQYEGRFYNACYKHDDEYVNCVDVESREAPFLYACCFSSKRENEAAWVLYSHNRTGLASRCVEFKLNRVKLREQLVKNLKDCCVYIGPVKYLNKEKIDHIHEKEIGKNNLPNEDYDKYFRPFIKECYLNLLLMKRSVFEHEKEVRLFVIPNDEVEKEKTRRGSDGKFSENVKPKSMLVDIDWTEVIEEVKIDRNCSEYEIKLLQDKLNILAEDKKKEKGLDKDAYEKLLSCLKLKVFSPYKDELLVNGPLTIITNQE